MSASKALAQRPPAAPIAIRPVPVPAASQAPPRPDLVPLALLGMPVVALGCGAVAPVAGCAAALVLAAVLLAALVAAAAWSTREPS